MHTKILIFFCPLQAVTQHNRTYRLLWMRTWVQASSPHMQGGNSSVVEQCCRCLCISPSQFIYFSIRKERKGVKRPPETELPCKHLPLIITFMAKKKCAARQTDHQYITEGECLSFQVKFQATYIPEMSYALISFSLPSSHE